MIYRLIVFLVINFGALGIGGFLMGEGPQSSWYVDIEKAPWTPPGWVFGAAWTTIMVCFSFYMAYLWPLAKRKKQLVVLFMLQWILNVGWNPVFFHFHSVLPALVVISGLTLLVGFFGIYYGKSLKVKSFLLLPYFVWLCIATSLNAYILVNN